LNPTAQAVPKESMFEGEYSDCSQNLCYVFIPNFYKLIKFITDILVRLKANGSLLNQANGEGLPSKDFHQHDLMQFTIFLLEGFLTVNVEKNVGRTRRRF